MRWRSTRLMARTVLGGRVRLGDQVSAEEVGERFGVDLIRLDTRVCDGFHFCRMSKDDFVDKFIQPVVHWSPGVACLENGSHGLLVVPECLTQTSRRAWHLLPLQYPTCFIHNSDVRSSLMCINANVEHLVHPPRPWYGLPIRRGQALSSYLVFLGGRGRTRTCGHLGVSEALFR